MADKPILSKKFNEDLDVDLMLREGGIVATLYIGVQGNDLAAAKKALETTIFKKMASDAHISLLEAKMYDILNEKGGKEGQQFSGVAEVKLAADDFRWFVKTILTYGPSAVEILEPSKVTLSSDQMHSIVADVSDFTHVYSQQIISMLKDPERRRLYEQMLSTE
jgi:hypothetical protein